MIFTHEAFIPLAAGDVHLDEWLFNLSDKDYKACAHGHRAVGTNGEAHFEGMVNVESMAGALIIQHYRTELLETNHVRLFSQKSRAYLMHLLPFHLQIGWEMQVFGVSENGSCDLAADAVEAGCPERDRPIALGVSWANAPGDEAQL